ncbi:MAG: MmcQ/YjbR family DNA-binding protein [Bacteroidota bacterium]|nr:MmcQ/YjbR family DNA-binding protein [Bacteroidota bacterium]
MTEDIPFNQSTLVFKLMGKMFALIDLEKSFSITLKCDPENAVVLRETYEAVKPAYHMDKKHWNDILINGSIQDECLIKLIDHSYDLVKDKLTRKERTCIESGQQD